MSDQVGLTILDDDRLDAAPEKPIPDPNAPKPRRDWLDDGTDCISSAFAEAGRLTYGEDFPNLTAIETAYRRWHPDWDDTPGTMNLNWYWEALASLGITPIPLHDKPALLLERLVENVQAYRYPVTWIWLWSPADGHWLHHAVVVVDFRDGRIVFWDQQRGIGWAMTSGEFLSPGTDGQWSGDAWVLDYQPAPSPVPIPPVEEPTAMNPMKKSMMLWQANNCREQSVTDWKQTLDLGGIDTFRLKTHHHLTWMARHYQHPLAPDSLDTVQRLSEEFLGVGIWFTPWCVPMGLNVRQEADFAIEVARRCGNRIDIDLEPYKDFWYVPQVGNGGIPEYFDRLKQAGIHVACDFDARSNLWHPLEIERISHLVDRFLTQSYWRGFGTSYESTIRHAVTVMRQIGAREMGIVADARAPRSEMVAAAAFAQSLGCVEWSCWAADMATPETYAGFALIPTDPMFADEEPGPDPPPGEPTVLDDWLTVFRRSGDIANQHPDTLPAVIEVHQALNRLKGPLGIG